MRPLLAIRYSLFALMLAALGVRGRGGRRARSGSAAYADPVYIGSQGEARCRPGPRRRYQIGRRCVWGSGASPVLTMRVPARRARRGTSVVRNAAFTAQVPGHLRRSAGPLDFPTCPPFLAAQLKCSEYYNADPFVRALIDNPNPATYPTLDEYGIPAIDGVPPIVIIDPKRAAFGTGFDTGGDFVSRGTVGSGIRSNGGDLVPGDGRRSAGQRDRRRRYHVRRDRAARRYHRQRHFVSPLRSGGGDITFGGTGGDVIFNGIGGPLGFGGGGGDIIYNGLP